MWVSDLLRLWLAQDNGPFTMTFTHIIVYKIILFLFAQDFVDQPLSVPSPKVDLFEFLGSLFAFALTPL